MCLLPLLKRTIVIYALISLISAPSILNAAPVDGEIFTLPQPDGSRVNVRIWGDEFYQVVESLDGYTLIRDPANSFICYARLSQDATTLLSTGVPVKETYNRTLGIEPHIRITPQAARAQIKTARDRWAAGYQQVMETPCPWVSIRNLWPQLPPEISRALP